MYGFSVYSTCDHRTRSVLTHSFPTRRSAALALLEPIVVQAAIDLRLAENILDQVSESLGFANDDGRIPFAFLISGHVQLPERVRVQTNDGDRKSTRLNSSH